MVKRIYVEKKKALRQEADGLFKELRTLLGVEHLTALRLLNRYDAEGLDEEGFRRAVEFVFSEPQLDDTMDSLPAHDGITFAVEYLPGQFDQRADSAAACIQLLLAGEKPAVRTARVYLLSGALTQDDLAAIKGYVINPVEAREASLDLPESLTMTVELPQAPEILTGFTAMSDDMLSELVDSLGLAMDLNDLKCCRAYFAEEGRDPTITEIRILDTYWSDHCRHTTFSTHLKDFSFADPAAKAAYDRYLAVREETNAGAKPVTLMDMATRGAKYLKKTGYLTNLDESEEINACTVKIDVDEDGEKKPWLLLFKNETHNHPTEIEPFGGAATCIGGAIRDPLAGRGYVYQAMRVTGAADPRASLRQTLPGKLPQRRIVQKAAQGYSSYGNQIGLATGLVDEMYHPGYTAKRLEIGAVVGAVPAGNVRRETPTSGDVVILLGGRTGRDGIGGATGSSKSHDTASVATCSAEVQKGNAPEERKLQRLFRHGEAVKLIKRCNDFGAGGVSVAVGELADSLSINLDKVTKKYEGLDATELAISESQERMAVVVEAKDAERFMEIADEENLEATIVATVTDTGRLEMTFRGQTVVSLSRAFLDTNGASREATVVVEAPKAPKAAPSGNFRETLLTLAGDLNVCSKQGLCERFDSTIGAGSLLMPFGGKDQKTPAEAMAAKLPVLGHDTTTCSIMAWGGDPYVMDESPYRGAYLAVADSVAKVIAAGGHRSACYLTFQEYFEKLGSDPKRWGKPAAALLGALSAQLDLQCAAIGGKDSMSGTFNDLDVPPTLVSFAVGVGHTKKIVSNEFKAAGNTVTVLIPKCDENGLPVPDDLRATLDRAEAAIASGKVVSASVVGNAGIAASVMKSAFGNRLGFAFTDSVTPLFERMPAAILLESTAPLGVGTVLGTVTDDGVLTARGERVTLSELETPYDGALEYVFPMRAPVAAEPVPTLEAPAFLRSAPKVGVAQPKVLIPVFPGTNCEYDSAHACERAGLAPEILVLNNKTAQGVADSAARFCKAAKCSQMIFLPGGFSGGDEPDGSGKFITAFFRNSAVKDATYDLLKNRDGLMLGICNGFQALIKLGLVPYGEIVDTDDRCPTLTYNVIGRHQSKIVRTRIASNRSPWLAGVQVGDVVSVPISHGEGRFLCAPELLEQLAENGQIATQYVDLDGKPTMDAAFNPNGSAWAVEGITSPDGRVFGKMGHAERIGPDLYQNVSGNYDLHLFDAAKDYFSL
ncbi:MAG: phosphoribosylformylglycinamidine synthase [Oscillibacter sp.]|jgi:phosphoribosylformylglycinamidine synthase|nr:phosphoribosylformylglycinamidine synthase [Oscillibacter sp.]